MTSKERLYAAVHGLARDRAPVTPIFMAWAAHWVGRTYREFQLDADVLVEAQLAVTRALDVDQISAISDPWREATGYGMTFDYPDEGVGIPHGLILNSPEDIADLAVLDPAAVPRMQQRVDSVAQMSAAVGETHSVLGWVEGPIAEYVDLRGMTAAMLDLVDAPEHFHRAAATLVETGVVFARAQIAAGADMIGVGDAAASLIGPELYARHVLPWEQKLIAGIHEAGGTVKLHVCGDIRGIVAAMADTGADVIDVDWMVPLAEARAAVGEAIALAGSFDPSAVLLAGDPETVAAAATENLAAAGDRFILQPGCEVAPGTPEENVRAFCPGPGCRITDALRWRPS